MISEFALGIERSARATCVSCSGELDVATAGRLREAVDLALDESPEAVLFDGRGVTLLASAGIRALYDFGKRCHEGGIRFEVSLSPEARRVLDVVGLWWLGVVPDGFALEGALDDALREYGRRPPRVIDLSEGDSESPAV